jgi:lipopolysaccharide/colanic/teichoic acid biosynthesis glycosyltransferase
LTGWTPVNGRNDLPWPDKSERDTWSIAQLSR